MGKCLSKNSDTTEKQNLSTEVHGFNNEEAENSITNAQSQLTVNYEILLGLIKNDSQILKLRSDHYVSEVLNAAVKKICNEKDEIANTYFLCLKYFEQVFICDNDSNYITPEKRKERIRRARENVGCLKSDFQQLRKALGDAEGRLENVRDGEARTSTLNQIQEMRSTLFELIACTAKMQSQMMKERFERNEENEKTMRQLMLDLSSKVIQMFYSYKDELREILYNGCKIQSEKSTFSEEPNLTIGMVKIEAREQFAILNHDYRRAYTFHRWQQFGIFRKNCDNLTRTFGFFDRAFKLQEPSFITTCDDIRDGLELSRRPELANILQILSGFSGDLLNADLSWSGDDKLFASLRQKAKDLVDSLHTLFSTIQSKIDRYQRYTEPANCGKNYNNERTFDSFYEEIRGSIRELSEIMLKFNVGESPAFDDSLSERPSLTWTGTASTSQIVVRMESTETETRQCPFN